MKDSEISGENLGHLHKMAGNPYVYSNLRRLMGGDRYRAIFLTNLVSLDIKPKKVLDLGCGPGQMASFFPNSDYVGLDNNPKYIDYAQSRNRNNAHFEVGDVTNLDANRFSGFDLIIAMGVLHHLSDNQAHSMLGSAARILSDGDHIATTDCARRPGNHLSATWMINRDRGEFVRQPDEYEDLVNNHFLGVRSFDMTGALRVPITGAPFPQHMVVASKAE